MDKTHIDTKRRRAVFTAIAAVAGAPFIKYLGQPVAAADLPHLDEKDPAATALKYRHDATQAERTDKPGGKASEQFCRNCKFIQAETGTWRPCQLFPGKAVNEAGWCSAWTVKDA